MEHSFAKAEELAAHVKEYFNNRISSVKLSAAEKSSKLAANILAALVACTVLVFFVLFASVALAFVFAGLTGEYYLGFLIVSGFYLLIGIVTWFARERLLRLPIMNSILQQLFKDEEEDEED